MQFSEEAQERKQRLEDVRYRLIKLANATTVRTGILHPGIPEVPILRQADGHADSAALTKQEWRECYFALRQNALNAAPMPDLQQIEETAAQIREGGTIPIAIGHYDYETPRQKFLDRIRLYGRKGGEFLMPDTSRPEEVLERKSAFFATPFLRHDIEVLFPRKPIHYGLQARFVVPRQLYLTNTGRIPEQVEVDAGDGQGFRSVALDQAFDVNYSGPGTKQIRVRVASETGASLQSSAELEVSAETLPVVNEYWQLKSQIPYKNITTTGHAWVLYGKGNAGIVSPVIVAEGFPGGYSFSYLWSVLNEQNFATNLLNQGKDLIILGFDQGTSYIEANSGVVIDCIRRTIQNRRGTNRLVTSGASMGGLIVRYALAYMEKLLLDHQTRLYFSFDSPHMGATVPLSVMFFASYFKDQSDAAKTAHEQLKSIAAQELLLAWIEEYNSPPQAPAPLRSAFITILQQLGDFPKQCRKLGVSNGSGQGVADPTPPCAEAFAVSATCVECDLYAAPGNNYSSTYPNLLAYAEIGAYWQYLSWTNAQKTYFDSSPGGSNNFFEQIATGFKSQGYDPTVNYTGACFIPAISALAMTTLSPYQNADLFRNLTINTPPSKLDAYMWDTTNRQHVTLTPEIARWLLQQVGATEAATAAEVGASEKMKNAS
jgi:hypothetical protein